MKSFPSTLYVKRVNEGDPPNEYLDPSETIEETAELDEAVVVGVYKLEKLVTVSDRIEVTDGIAASIEKDQAATA